MDYSRNVVFLDGCMLVTIIDLMVEITQGFKWIVLEDTNPSQTSTPKHARLPSDIPTLYVLTWSA